MAHSSSSDETEVLVDAPTMQQPPRDTLDQSPTAHASTLPRLSFDGGGAELGALVGDEPFDARYREIKRLGEGGMGVVTLCHDARIGREVAVKLLREDNGSTRGAAEGRFAREARVQGQLEHPAIVPVHDLGRTASGAVFFTMKRVRGLTLADALDMSTDRTATPSRSFNRRRLLTAFSQVCLAVDFAHARGVIHRDLKPANIMLGDFGEVYVLDWGIAKPARARGADELARDGATGHEAREHTAIGAVVGTPGYMSPEQARGEVDRLTPRSDVYSLGVVLFEILVGEPLHRGHTVVALLESTMRGTHATASARAPGREVPPELDEVCARATALDPRERYASAREVHDAIERYLDGDRDLARRCALAAESARAAEREAACALLGGDDAIAARRRAIRDVGRALALDPGNTDAMGTLVALLTQPPERVPPEVQEEAQRDADRAGRSMSRVGALGFCSMLGFLPIVAWMGVRDGALVGLCVAAIVLGTLSALAAAARASRPAISALLIPIAGAILIAAHSRLFGPFVVAPTLAVGIAVSAMLHPQIRQRVFAVAVLCAGMLVPFALELAGVLPPSYVFRDDGMLVLAQMAHLPRVPTLIYLAASPCMALVAISMFTARTRDGHSEADMRVRLQSWQARQMLPSRDSP